MKDNDAQIDESTEYDYKNRDHLEVLYHEKGYNLTEVGEITGCSTTTVGEWMERFDIPRRKSGPGNEPTGDEPDNAIDHTDAEVLRDLYIDEGLSLTEIASRSAVTHQTIRHHLIQNGIERRSRKEGVKQAFSDKPAYYMQASNGYRTWKDRQSGRYMSVHRLLAIAEYGFDAVDGNVVHHKNGVRWDNRPENIEVMTPSEHAKHHVDNGDFIMGE